jgi:putative ABC transport system permease protein
VILSIVGYLPGLIMASILYWLTRYFAGIPVYMDAFRLILVLGCSVGFCILSGLGALWKVRQAEPAELF